MRRRPVFALAAASLAVPLALVPVAPAAAVQQSRVTFSGEVAMGEWSTCEPAVAGKTCVVTDVVTSDAVTTELDGSTGRHPAFLRDRAPTLTLTHTWYRLAVVDGELTGVPLKESTGIIGTPSMPSTPGNPAVTIDTRLRSGTAAARALRMRTTTDEDPDTTTWSTESVSTAWRGTGPLEPVHEGGVRFMTSRVVLRGATNGWMRAALATGTSSVLRDWGAFVGGELFHVRQTSSQSYRGRVTDPVAETVTLLRAAVLAADDQVWRLRTTGGDGEAFWTTCPAPRPGQTCRDTNVSYWFDSGERTAMLDVSEYVVVDVGDGWVDARYLRSLTSTSDDAALTAPADLSTAHVAVPHADAEVCDEADECTTVRVSWEATWTPTGPLVRFASRSTSWEPGYRAWSQTRGSTRTATVTGSVADLPAAWHLDGAIAGTQQMGQLASYRMRLSSVAR